MTYTLSQGLRDREYAKFTPEDIGSITGVNVSNVLKTYNFGLQTANAAGVFAAHSTKEINGMLKGIAILENTYVDTGSLTLRVSGLNIEIWQMASGVDADVVDLPTVDQSGGYIVKAHARTNYGATLSGTVNNGVWCDIPLYGHYTLIGSDMGNGTSGLGVVLVYQ